MQAQANNKLYWLILPPALAFVLFLGPMGPQPIPAATPPLVATAQPTSTPQPGGAIEAATPSLWQITSALGTVLLIGAVGVLLLNRFRQRSLGGAHGPLALRQSLRLSARHSVHVVQFDDRLMLLGECDGSLALLEQTSSSDFTAADLDVAQRDRATDNDDAADDGAVPPDLLLPKRATRLPTSPRRASSLLPTPPGKATPSKAEPSKPGKLADFKKLLDLARVSASGR